MTGSAGTAMDVTLVEQPRVMLIIGREFEGGRAPDFDGIASQEQTGGFIFSCFFDVVFRSRFLPKCSSIFGQNTVDF